jgi:hypothetical protein
MLKCRPVALVTAAVMYGFASFQSSVAMKITAAVTMTQKNRTHPDQSTTFSSGHEAPPDRRPAELLHLLPTIFGIAQKSCPIDYLRCWLNGSIGGYGCREVQIGMAARLFTPK